MTETEALLAGLHRTRDADAKAAEPELYLGFVEALGLDLLVTKWPSGSVEVAYREGPDRRGITWSPPYALTAEPAS